MQTLILSYNVEFAEKDHDVVVLHGTRPDCLRLRLLEDPRIVKIRFSLPQQQRVNFNLAPLSNDN